MSTEKAHITNFIRKIIDEDLKTGKHQSIVTRFPPEPNGYLHIGHAKAICLNFGVASDYNGTCHLRFDDTNPCNESDEYKHAIERDVKWLGFDWGEKLFSASNYFDDLYEIAINLIKEGKAFVCSLSAEQMRVYRGTLTEPGKNSPDRDRSIKENLSLFEQMCAGEFEEGQYSLRAKIDMSSGNINLRDPVIYRIRKVHHHNTGDKWCIYPTYDYAHSLSDALEGITHSLCSLEFQDHRPLYDWCVENANVKARPQQIEFSRLNLTKIITSKRKLKALVEEGLVNGWDDPRMPTIAGLRRRGYTPESIRTMCDQVGISKQDSIIDYAVLEACLRDDLNTKAERRMAVVRPIKVVLTNYDEGEKILSLKNHPQNEEMGRRDVAFSKEIYIDSTDFMLDPPKDFFRLGPGRRVRLLNAYVIECDQIIQNEDGSVKELHCHYLPETLGGKKPDDGIKVKGFIHWVSAAHAIDAEVRWYDHLFTVDNPGKEADFHAVINPHSLKRFNAKVEPALAKAQPGESYQFNRVGYFTTDMDHSSKHCVFNLSVSLKS